MRRNIQRTNGIEICYLKLTFQRVKLSSPKNLASQSYHEKSKIRILLWWYAFSFQGVLNRLATAGDRFITRKFLPEMHDSGFHCHRGLISKGCVSLKWMSTSVFIVPLALPGNNRLILRWQSKDTLAPSVDAKKNNDNLYTLIKVKLLVHFQ